MEKTDKCTESNFECHLYFDIMLGCIKEMDNEIKKNPDTWLNNIWDIKEDENHFYHLMGTKESLFLSKYIKSTKFYQHSKLKFTEQVSTTPVIKKALLYNCRIKEESQMRLIILHKDNTIAIREISGKLIRCLKYCDEEIINLYTNLGEESRGVIAVLSGAQAKIIYFSNKFFSAVKLDEGRPYRIEFEGVTGLQEVIIRKTSKKESKVIGLAVNPNLFTLNVILKEHFKSKGFSLAGIFSWTKKPPPEETEKDRSFVRLSLLKKVHLEYEQPRSIRIDKAGDLALVCEEKGRVFLFDLSLFIVVRMWKGYRDCWMNFFVVTTPSNHTIEYAIIYSYMRGLLEIYQLRHGIKVYSKYIGNGIRLFDCPKPLIISKEKKIYVFSIQNEAEISEENLSDLYVKKFLSPKQWAIVLFGRH